MSTTKSFRLVRHAKPIDLSTTGKRFLFFMRLSQRLKRLLPDVFRLGVTQFRTKRIQWDDLSPQKTLSCIKLSSQRGTLDLNLINLSQAKVHRRQSMLSPMPFAINPASKGIMNSNTNSRRSIKNTFEGTATISSGLPFRLRRKKTVG